MPTSVALPSMGYSSSAEEVAMAIQALMALKPLALNSGHRFALQTVRPEDPWVLKRLPRVGEARVFEMKFHDTPDLRQQAWEPFEDKDTAIVALSLPGERQCETCLEGAIRLLVGHQLADFKSVINMLMHQDWGIETLRKIEAVVAGDWTRVGDVATLAIDPNAESKLGGEKLWMSMFHALHLMVDASGIDILVGIMAQDLFDKLQRIGMGLQEIGECRDYFGWPSTPFLLQTRNLPATLRSAYADRILNGLWRPGQPLSSVVAFADDLRLGI